MTHMKRITCFCINCKTEISVSNLKNHFQSKVCQEKLQPIKEKSTRGNFHLNTPEAIEKKSKTIKKLHENGIYKNSYENRVGHSLSEDHKNKISKSLRGRTIQQFRKTTHEYVDKIGRVFKFDSSWEDALADRLDALCIIWDRPECVFYIDKHGHKRSYFPDFYLPLHNLYLDPKNPFAEKIQKEKLEIVSTLINLRLIKTKNECLNFSLTG